MASTSEIRRRIASVRETQKITHAMYLISQAKLRRAKEELERTRPYFNALRTEIKRIFRVDESVESRYFSPEDAADLDQGTYGLLVITADKGLAGAYNQNVIRRAQAMMERGELPGNMLVATAMSNLALEIFMKERAGTLLRTKVGDRYVMEAMRKTGAMLGGEQSGHLIYRQYSTTGDGLLAALQLLRIVREKEKPLSELAGLLHLFPQKLINVRVEKKLPFEERPAIGKAVADVEKALAGRGRVLLRYSGTEALCRVMVEAEDEDKVVRYARDLADVVSRELR